MKRLLSVFPSVLHILLLTKGTDNHFSQGKTRIKSKAPNGDNLQSATTQAHFFFFFSFPDKSIWPWSKDTGRRSYLTCFIKPLPESFYSHL